VLMLIVLLSSVNTRRWLAFGVGNIATVQNGGWLSRPNGLMLAPPSASSWIGLRYFGCAF